VAADLNKLNLMRLEEGEGSDERDEGEEDPDEDLDIDELDEDFATHKISSLDALMSARSCASLANQVSMTPNSSDSPL
jgi:hypothetical protein